MYKCLDCGCVFDEPKKIIENHGLDNPPYENMEICPACSSSNFRETYPCDQCGIYIDDDYIELSDGSKVCNECYIKVNF